MVSYFTIHCYGRLLKRFSNYHDFARFIDVLTIGKGFWVALERRLKMKHPIPTVEDKNQILDRLPCVKANLISDLKAMGWKEKWIRHLIWLLQRREYKIFICQGIVKKV